MDCRGIVEIIASLIVFRVVSELQSFDVMNCMILENCAALSTLMEFEHGLISLIIVTPVGS